jgi:hypothetical protein
LKKNFRIAIEFDSRADTEPQTAKNSTVTAKPLVNSEKLAPTGGDYPATGSSVM